MTKALAQIWRYPIKSHGREALEQVALEAGRTMSWDRTWAVAHEGTRTDGTEWAPCANFSRGAKAPGLMAISTELDETSERVTLRHPERPDLTVHPDRDANELIDWVRPLMPENRAQSTHIIRVPGRGMTDSDFPSISLNSLSSHRAVEQKLGYEIDPLRWRGNLILEGLDVWEEFDWIGKTVAIGSVELEIRERITRCLATTANPATGQRDADTLKALETWNHQDFGVYGVVTKGGQIALGDAVRVL